MEIDQTLLFGLLAAIGGGLIVGTERERRKGEGQQRSAIGMRTCTLAALTGAVAEMLGTPALLIAGAGVIALTLAAYLRSDESDPGLTTEFAVLATFVLGALAMAQAQLAAALFVGLTIILLSKESLHRFARQVLSERELSDGLLLAASALIVMPLLPDRTIDPFGVLNPRKLWLLAVMVMSINAAGYIALRAFGPGRGLPLAGFFGGFVSSAATIAGMSQRARERPELRRDCIAGALLSNVATIAEMALILFAVSSALLHRFAVPLAIAGAVVVATGAVALFAARNVRDDIATHEYGRAFAPRNALIFAAIVALALFAAAALRHWLGAQGVTAAAAAAGFADVHAATIAVGQMVAAGGVSADDAAIPLAIAFTTNSLVKCGAAVSGGDAVAARAIIAGTVVLNIALVLAVVLA